MTQRSAEDALQDLAQTGSIRDFTNALIFEFGGPAKMAQNIALEYESLPEGSGSRVRLLTLALSFLAKYGTDDTPDDLEELEKQEAELAAQEAAEEELAG